MAHRLRLVVLNRMLQEAAWQHALLLGKGFIDKAAGGYYWVLARLRLSIDSLPKWGDTFTIETYPVGTDRMFALREFAVLDADNYCIGRATSGWLVVDAGRQRPVRPESLVADLDLSQPCYTGPTGKLEPPGQLTTRYGPYPVRLHDIDQYRHVNNTAYLEWILDSLAESWPESDSSPPDDTDHDRLCGVDVRMDFLQEAVLTDHYVIDVENQDRHLFAEVRRTRDNQPCCRCELLWRG
jgi:medium-chain acyl-[acyl-carrier-protein] hydrolase